MTHGGRSAGGSYGIFFELWRQPISEIRPTGADKGKGGKFVVVPMNSRHDPEDCKVSVTRGTSIRNSVNVVDDFYDIYA
jgi:hypothetical protein